MRLWLTGTLIVVAVFSIAGCGSSSSSSGSGAKNGSGDEPEISAEEKPYYDAGKPFYEAIAARSYAKAYDMLSSHAKAQMMLFQFNPGTNDSSTERHQKQKYENVSAAKFSELMAHVEKEHGRPKAMSDLDVFSTDEAVLTRTSKEQLGAVDSMFAIGAMPNSIPMTIRKASLRGQVVVELSDSELAEAAKAHGMSVEELKADEDFKPYFNLKVVLVEEEGKLKVGYFEFMPPSMMD
jgi:hypothetical protein